MTRGGNEIETVSAQDRYATVDGLRVRYLEDGTGKPALLLHGASLGSSTDVFRRNLPPLGRGGVRAITYDSPGFGLSDSPADLSGAYRRDFTLRFMDALGLDKAALIAHSQAGGPAVGLVLKQPQRFSHLVILGSGSLLPPLANPSGAKDETAQQRLERRMANSEPTIEDTRKLLEATLYHHELITPEELALRHSMSIGRNFHAFVARNRAALGADKAQAPLWPRLTELGMPLLMIYGRNDRANAAERALLLKHIHPEMNIFIVEHCKHLVPWDAADEFVRLTLNFLNT